ncbi:MAG TPA: PIG-L family deacetylase [Gemmatimonadales bacterium]|nr:PIG-L family deacetylase [Gemmatimonadales bacterium]
MRTVLACLISTSFAAVHPLVAQLEPPSAGGAVALDHELRLLGHYKRVLMIGAHPDDEDTELLTVLVRGEGAEAAYLSLNRGEGGQNVIGPELGEALGLLRTEELLAARRLDGARQFFSRAYDFGFSKTQDETWTHWPRDSVLKDVVRVVRRFRPQVIVSIFSGTPRDGHGQHQAAGWAAQEAFRIAGDATRFPELERDGLTPWTPLKLYRSTRFDSAATTLVLEGGVLDSAVGKSYHQIAMAGRSLHRSQDMGQLQRIGPSVVRLRLIEDRTGRGGDGLWAGIDTTLAGMAAAGGSGSGPAALWDSLARAIEGYRRSRTPPLAETLGRFGAALPQTGGVGSVRVGTASAEQWDQLTRLQHAIQLTSGVVCDAVADDQRVVPGQVLHVAATCWNAGSRVVTIPVVLLRGNSRWPWLHVSQDGDSIAPDGIVNWSFDVTIPDTAGPSGPYFLDRPRAGDLYTWPAQPAELLGLPFEDPLITAEFGADVEPREVSFRYRDQTAGEVRRPVTVVPRVDVKLDPDTLVWPSTGQASRRFTVTLVHGARDTTTGSVRLIAPAGWTVGPSQPFTLEREDETRSFAFDVRPPAAVRPGTAAIRAEAADRAGAHYDTGVFAVAYPHIRPRTYRRPATASVRVAPLALPRLARVGYVRGAADRVPEALQSVGVPVTLLDGAALERGDLSRFDAIVIGCRAYETEPALTTHNGRLLDYARRGGLVVVQYQQYEFFARALAPFPMTVGGQPLRLEAATRSGGTAGAATSATRATPPVTHDRVTDESAPVRVLRPSHPVFHVPNRIASDDWVGWVQERGLYFAHSWDPAYVPLLETHDPGEGPLEGSLLVARVGKGTYVYTALSFFRQLPAGVPGAYRLFANILALASPSR